MPSGSWGRTKLAFLPNIPSHLGVVLVTSPLVNNLGCSSFFEDQVSIMVGTSVRGEVLSLSHSCKHMNLLSFASEVLFDPVDTGNSCALPSEQRFEGLGLPVVVDKFKVVFRLLLGTQRVGAFFKVEILKS